MENVKDYVMGLLSTGEPVESAKETEERLTEICESLMELDPYDNSKILDMTWTALSQEMDAVSKCTRDFALTRELLDRTIPGGIKKKDEAGEEIVNEMIVSVIATLLQTRADLVNILVRTSEEQKRQEEKRPCGLPKWFLE